jgi:ergot alkaloid biosynthesis protein
MTSHSTILLTGGTGKTGRRLASLLNPETHTVRIASRSGEASHGHDAVRFDWKDEATYRHALEGVGAVYLVAPMDGATPLSAMLPFLEQALSAGVKRYVLLSASSLEAGGPMMGEVHAWLAENVPEWAVLRPTWFMQNFSEMHHRFTISNERRIYSATRDGRVPFVDATDIAKVGAHALVNGDALNRDVIVTGSKTLSYDEVAELISEACGFRVEHVKIDEAELASRHAGAGVDPQFAKILASMDTAIAEGMEDRVTNEVETLTGHEPSNFATFAASVASVWAA